MAKGFDRLHVKSAVKSHSKFNLDGSHLTTMSFGQIMPLYAKEMVAGDKFNIQSSFFSRMAPLVRPTYGNFSFKTMNVFVPFHQIAYDIDAWFDGKNTWEGITPNSRFFTVQQLCDFLADNRISVVSNSTDYDFSYINSSGTTAYKKFGDLGKYVWKVLCALGYTYPQNVDMQTGSYFLTHFGAKKLSALPLLCFAKAYNDYMSQSQRYNTSTLTYLLRCIKYNQSYTGYNTTQCTMDYRVLYDIFSSLKLCYENDYFTSAWQWPNSALNTSETLATVPVPEAPFTGQLVRNTTNDNYLDISSSSGVVSVLNQRGLNWLKAFDDFVRRNNYSGSRVVQQIYSRFGIKPEDYRSHYADVISTEVMPIQVGDVTATTTATGQPLGDFAGKGIMSGSKGFSYHTSDRGMIFVMGWFTVNPMMSYGFDHSVLKSSPLDYYNPEFDGQAIQPISYAEVFTDIKNLDSSDNSSDDQVFGFTELYNDYRFSRDVISGEFRKYDNTSPDNTWHAGRLLTSVRGAGEMVAQSSSMNTLPQYSSEFQRIFSITNVDPFYLTCRFKVSAVRPMLSLNQVPKLGEGDVNVPRNGNEIN